jgi:hypothetical protein
MSIKSMDDLPDVEHTFEFRVGLAEILVPEPPSPLLGPCWWCGCTCPDNVHDCNRICDACEKEVDRDL